MERVSLNMDTQVGESTKSSDLLDVKQFNQSDTPLFAVTFLEEANVESTPREVSWHYGIYGTSSRSQSYIGA